MVFIWAAVPIVLIFVFAVSFSFADDAEPILTWSQANYKVTNGTGTATIIVNDNEKNQFSFFVEEVKVFVYSDSFVEGITLTLYETEKNSGTFERTFSFSDSRSAPNILLAQEGDTAIVVYTDDPLPDDYLYHAIDYTATALIGSSSPPLERVPASNARITDIQGNLLGVAVVDEQTLLTSDIANQMTRNQTFAWLVQVIDSEKKNSSSVLDRRHIEFQ